MAAPSDTETLDMPATYDPLEQCEPGVEVSKRRVAGSWPEECLAVQRAGDYEIISREQHPTRPAWLRFTIRKLI